MDLANLRSQQFFQARADDLNQPEGGFTYGMDGKPAKDTFAVGIRKYGDQRVPRPASAADVESFVVSRANQGAFDPPNRGLGGWAPKLMPRGAPGSDNYARAAIESVWQGEEAFGELGEHGEYVTSHDTYTDHIQPAPAPADGSPRKVTRVEK